jgi:ABC-type polysaccharide/polyol phosphate export permease
LVTRREALQGIIFAAVFPLWFVSSAFVSTASMPDWLAWFADRQPMTLVVNAVRDLTLGINQYGAELVSIVWSVAIVMVALPLGVALQPAHDAVAR